MQEIDRNRVRQLMADGAQIVEVLPKQEFTDSHLPGATHVPLRRIDADARSQLDPSRPVVVYCWDSA
ncbi:MAG TPA: rhodanese-like domain-containing protein [Actinomycetota bacterium]|nr:rhodanese-like domain-containing protein [Actinomycetota bacterium]